MRKKISLLIFTLLITILFSSNINALTCKYSGSNKHGQLTLTFDILKEAKVSDGIVDGYMATNGGEKYYVENEEEDIDNWDSKEAKESKTGKEYYKSTGECPQKAIVVDITNVLGLGNKFHVYVAATDSDLDKFIAEAREDQGYQIVEIIDPNLINKKYTINFINEKKEATGSMSKIEATYGNPIKIPESGFKLPGFTVVSYKVKNNGKWLCKNENYKENCGKDSNFYIISPGSIHYGIKFDKNHPQLDLYVHWKPNGNLDSQTINQYNLGESWCTAQGYVWNEKNGGYCNTDKLQYVTCGDTYDIPTEVPSIVSYVVNLLKIITPIILIIVSIITLLKALAASNEDEIKKAQKSLTRKIIGAVMVFVIISIVQFVILKVADESEANSVSSCMSCFLNNDCIDTTYYKTNIGGSYFCTRVIESGREDIEACNGFYERIRSN